MKSIILCSIAGVTTLSALDMPSPRIHKVTEALSSDPSYSPSHSIKQAIDGSIESANWHHGAVKKMDGEFRFAAPVTLDGIRFVNPSFNRIKLNVKIAGKWQKMGDLQLSSAGVIRFKQALKNVEAVKIRVGDPESDKNIFFALREIEFYQKAKVPFAAAMEKVFTDGSCSALKPNISAKDIAALPQTLQDIAKAIQSGDYPDAEYRIASYKSFSSPELARSEQKINALSPFDNPTGIYAEQGDEILVFVGPTHGHNIDLISNKPFSLQNSSYPLEEGINKVKINTRGLLYIAYHNDSGKASAPITVHIPQGSGKINGYFDIAKHTDSDWKKLISSADFDVFDIVGKDSMMILTTKYLQQYSPDAITESVNIWDDGTRAIREIMGFYKYPTAVNNRMLGFSTEGGAHMFSTEYGCGYSNGGNGYNLKNEIIAPSVKQGKRIWGIGHEVGHSHQAVINWPSMTESSNNFFAQLILDQCLYSLESNPTATDMENPCKYLLEQAVKGVPFHDMNGWAQWGFAQYSFYLYFHKLGINPEFYPDLFQSLRANPINAEWGDPARCHLNWYERICHESKTDFTEDFEIFNWFVPIDVKKHQYGDYHYKLTKEMADAAKARIKAKNYPKPKFRIAFIHQHGKDIELWGKRMKGSELNGFWTKYRDNAQLSPQVKASKEGNLIKVTHGENAAAFCVKTDGKVVGYYDRPQFDISGIKWNSSSEVYAIPLQTAQPYKLIYQAAK